MDFHYFDFHYFGFHYFDFHYFDSHYFDFHYFGFRYLILLYLILIKPPKSNYMNYKYIKKVKSLKYHQFKILIQLQVPNNKLYKLKIYIYIFF